MHIFSGHARLRSHKLVLDARTAQRFQATGDKPAFLWDDEVRGFGLSAMPGGKKSWVVAYTQQTYKRKKIGNFGAMTLAEARAVARAFLARVQQGECPATDAAKVRKSRQESKSAHSPHIKNPGNGKTVSDLVAAYYAAGAPTKSVPVKSRSTLERELQRMRRDVLPRIGALPVARLNPEDIDRFYKELKDATRWDPKSLRLMRQCMAWGVKNGWRQDNPFALD